MDADIGAAVFMAQYIAMHWPLVEAAFYQVLSIVRGE